MKTTGYSSTIVAIVFCWQCLLAEESFYQRYEKIVDTSGLWPTGINSPSLVDTNNTVAKLTNVVIRLDNLRTNSEVAGIRLGMTTDEVVARWGRPRGLQCSSAAGPNFNYIDTRLRFKTNALDCVHIPRTAQFDHGLRGDSTLKDWMRVLGEPIMRKDDQFGSWLVYEFRGMTRTVLLLSFDPDGEAGLPPVIYHDPDLTRWFKPLKQ
jgi:hypothetical protein